MIIIMYWSTEDATIYMSEPKWTLSPVGKAGGGNPGQTSQVTCRLWWPCLTLGPFKSSSRLNIDRVCPLGVDSLIIHRRGALV
jgi:hypothetical protein